MAIANPSGGPAPLAVGMVLAQRFRLEMSLGAGGMAEVFRATDMKDGRAVAVKVLRQQLTESAEAVQRFRREGQVLAALKNPAVVGIEAVHELSEGRIFIVMELLEGETLGGRMKRGPMSARELAPIVAGCAAGLAGAHASGVVHRDLKPDNIFLAHLPNGDTQVKVLDFGVSKVRGEEKLTQTGQVLGTPRYMSPEQLGAEPDVDPRVDVYALGVILYEALSGGKSPFVATTPTDLIVAILNGKIVPLRSVKSDVPAALESVVLRAMAKVRDARYGSVTELADAFFEAGNVQLRGSPKAQLGTSVMGQMRTAPHEGAGSGVSAPDASKAPLREGTFSELEAFDVRPPDRGTMDPPRGPQVDVPLVARVSNPGPSPRAIPPTAMSPMAVVPASAPLQRSPEVAPTAPAVIPRPDPTGPRGPRRDASGMTRDAAGPVEIPMSGGRIPSGILLITVGLLAGGLAAGAVIAVLTWISQMRGSLESAPPPPPPSVVAVLDAGRDGGPADAGVTTAEAAGGSRGAGAGAGVVVARAETGSAGASEGAGSGGEAATEGGSSGTGTVPSESGSGSSGTGTAASESGSGSGSAVDPILAATRALARGDAAECVDILDDVIAHGRGGPMALRRRADCLARMGDMREAIRDYQRYCRLVPDHPGIAEVREILEGLGQTCP